MLPQEDAILKHLYCSQFSLYSVVNSFFVWVIPFSVESEWEPQAILLLQSSNACVKYFVRVHVWKRVERNHMHLFDGEGVVYFFWMSYLAFIFVPRLELDDFKIDSLNRKRKICR